MISYRATLDVSRELVLFTAGLLAAERRRRGTPRGSRKLACYWQAVLGLRWFRDKTAIESLARDHGISRATGYRYVDEVIEVLAAEAPELPDALARAMAEGVAFVILDGKIVPSDRCLEKTTSVKGEAIDLWYSGKAHHHGGNIQAVARPDGLPLWVSPAEPGSVHDIIARQPDDGRELDPGNRTRNAIQRSLRCLGERAFALLNSDGAPSSTSPPAPAKSPESPAPPSSSPNTSTATSNDAHPLSLRSPH